MPSTTFKKPPSNLICYGLRHAFGIWCYEYTFYIASNTLTILFKYTPRCGCPQCAGGWRGGGTSGSWCSSQGRCVNSPRPLSSVSVCSPAFLYNTKGTWRIIVWYLLRSQKYRDTVWGFNMNGDEGSDLIRTTGEATLTCTTLWVELNLAVSPASTQCWCVRFRSSIDAITYQQPHTQTTEETYSILLWT